MNEEKDLSDASVRRVVIASFVGMTIEWHDFFIYGTAAALVFGKLFFPAGDEFIQDMAALGSFAIGFFARPLGGVIFGHFGDRIGRKAMLVTTLMMMGLATFLIGVLPTYESIGIAAPIILVLLRIVQGFGVGGEWGGAVLMAVEHGHKGKRGFYGSCVQMGVPVACSWRPACSSCSRACRRISSWPGVGVCPSCWGSCCSASGCSFARG